MGYTQHLACLLTKERALLSVKINTPDYIPAIPKPVLLQVINIKYWPHQQKTTFSPNQTLVHSVTR